MRRVFLGIAALGLALAQPFGLARAQTAPTPPARPEAKAPDPERVFGLALSSAVLQGRVAEIAAAKDTRPEVKDFARGMVQFRLGQVERLKAFGRERGLKIPTVEEFEHQVILENLQPLDYLGLSRRYAEVQVQALEQEIGIYQAGERGPDAAVKGLAAETIPELRQRLDAANALRKAVGP